jgi:thiosulfate dehydrogenase
MRGFLLGILFTLVALAFAAVFAVRSGRIEVAADQNPPYWERRIAGMALKGFLERNVPERANPVQPTEKNLAAGLRLYRDTCSGCHGRPGQKDHVFGRAFYPHAPQFPAHGTPMGESAIFWVTKHGIRRSGMPAWDGYLKDDEIWSIATFLSHIDHLPPAVEAVWKEPVRPPAK